MKRALATLLAALTLSGCQAGTTTCQNDGGDACLSIAATAT